MKTIFLPILLFISNFAVAQQNGSTFWVKKTEQVELIEASEKFFNEKIKTDKIVGLSAALIIDGKVIWQKGFGFADQEAKTPMNSNTVINIGSITKTFTALSILQLQEKGLIDINHPLTIYLPQFHPKSRLGFDPNEISVKSIITHTSGIQSDIWKNSDLETGKYTDVVGFINDTYLLYPAGMVGLYSNAGYNILGHMIKAISKEDYPAYIHHHIFSVLGMSHSGFAMDKLIGRTKLYAYGKEIKEYELRDLASGGIYTNMNDFTKYAIGLLDAYQGKKKALISQKSMKEMFSLQNLSVPLETNKKGLGWFMLKNDSASAMYHAGSAGFAQAKILLFPNKNAAAIVMTNTAEGSGAAEEFCFNLLPRFGLSIADLFPAPITGKIHDSTLRFNPQKLELKRHEGSYGQSTHYITISADSKQLSLTDEDKHFILKPISAEEYIPFRVNGVDTLMEKSDQRYYFKEIQGYHYLIKRKKNREYNMGYRLKPVDDILWSKRTGLYEQFGYQMLIGDSKFKSIEIYVSPDRVLMCRLKTMGSTNEIPLDIIDDHYALSCGVNSGFGGFNVIFNDKDQIVNFAGITYRKSK